MRERERERGQSEDDGVCSLCPLFPWNNRRLECTHAEFAVAAVRCTISSSWLTMDRIFPQVFGVTGELPILCIFVCFARK